MYKNAVIPAVEPGTRPFNNSCNSYFILDSRFAARPGMTHDGGAFMYQECGFTLIELLVVVLIIGILAAVAIPKYRVAMAKAKLMKIMPLMQAINQAQESFYLANGYYTHIKNVDVNIPQDYISSYVDRDFLWADDTFITQCGAHCGDETTVRGGISYKGNMGWAVISIWFYGQHASTYPGRRVCKANHFPGPEICKSLGGVPIEGERNKWLLP